ncbi:MAG: hypothetical protein R3195_19590 [Gemmatimonadota bacterium]|nr:hypothetical protein [Gemmatimonadota bacterium]
MLPSIVVLSLIALYAGVLTARRGSPPEKASERVAASKALAVAVVAQGVHLAEEAVGDLPARLPALFGERPVPLSIFLTINLVWLGIWAVSVWMLRGGASGAFFAAWFLALAGILNGVAHPARARPAGGYIPGQGRTPAVAAAGVLLAPRLTAATEPLPTGAPSGAGRGPPGAIDGSP